MVYTFVKGKKKNQQDLIIDGLVVEEGIFFFPEKGIDQRAIKAVKLGFVEGEDEFEGEDEKSFMTNYYYSSTLLTNIHALREQFPNSYYEGLSHILNKK